MKMERLRNYSVWSLVFTVFIVVHLLCPATGSAGGGSPGLVATKESRRRLVHTNAGEITAVDVSNGRKDGGSYHLEFFTLDTGSLFLPVLLHTDMIFYVHTGRGNVSWIDKKIVKVIQVEEGDIYRLEEGTVFYIQSSEDPNRIKLRIHAIFNTWDDQETLADSFTGGAYSSISDLVRGFDVEVLQSAFGASADIIKEIMRSERVPPIIRFGLKNMTERNPMDWREGIIEALSGKITLDYVFRNKKNDEKAFSILKEKADVENSHGRSTAVTHKEARSLKGSSMGVFMVNLTEGSMIGPHWNPRATEIAIVVEGHGMVQVIIPSDASGVHVEDNKSITKRFYVKEGDVFVVPRFYPMAQMSFQNSSFVFIGFSNNAKKNHPQFLAGKWSVLRTMKKEIMAASLDVESSTLDELLGKQKDGVLLGCDGCAEEVEKKMEVKIKWEEEEKRRKEEEKEAKKEEKKRKKEEEEEAKRREEEEEQRKIEEEEEAKRREEEQEQREKEEEEKAKRREEEKQRKKEEEEEAKRREEEEEQREKEEEEEAKRREEEEKQREKEEEEEAKREEEEKQREREEEEEEQREKEEVEEAKRREEEEKQREKEEEEEEQRKEEETKRREEEKEGEEEAKRRKEEEKQKEEEEAQRREEEQWKKEEEEEHKREEEEVKREEEEKQKQMEMEEEARGREEEEEIRREEEKTRKKEEVEEEEAQRRWEEEQRREREGKKEREIEETPWEEGGGRLKWRRMWMI